MNAPWGGAQRASAAALLSPQWSSPTHTCRRRYACALELLLTAITAPTQVVNAITVACLKKYVLVSLIHRWERRVAPRGDGSEGEYVAQHGIHCAASLP